MAILKVDNFEVEFFPRADSFSITKDSKRMDHMGIDDLYALEFIVKELKRRLPGVNNGNIT